MEAYKAKLDDKGEAVKEANGRLARTSEMEPMGHQDFVFSLPRLAKPRN